MRAYKQNMMVMQNNFLQVMYIQAFLLVILAGKIMKKLFFGELRPAEFEVSCN